MSLFLGKPLLLEKFLFGFEFFLGYAAELSFFHGTTYLNLDLELFLADLGRGGLVDTLKFFLSLIEVSIG